MKGQKMCKHKEVNFTGLFDRMKGIPTIQCSNKNISGEHIEKVKQNTKYCCRRLCPFYESR